MSLRDPQNRAKVAKIAKMDKNEGKKQVFVFIMKKKREEKNLFHEVRL